MNGKSSGSNCHLPKLQFFSISCHEYEEGKVNYGNRVAMKQLVWDNKPTGILALYEEVPIAWCALSPREDFLRLQKSRVHKPIDDKKVWSVPCTFVAKEFRNQGVSIALLKGLEEYAKQQGLKILEAYPTIPTQEKLPDAFAWIGLYKYFERAGFEIVDRKSKHRPMVRYYID